MTIQRRSRSELFFITSYSILGLLLLIVLIGTAILPSLTHSWLILQLFTIIGFAAVDLLIYIQYDMHTLYKEWKNKTEEERKAENKRRIKASKAAWLIFGPFLIFSIISYFKIEIGSVWGFLLLDLVIVGASAYLILYYKIDKK